MFREKLGRRKENKKLAWMSSPDDTFSCIPVYNYSVGVPVTFKLHVHVYIIILIRGYAITTFDRIIFTLLMKLPCEKIKQLQLLLTYVAI